MIRRVEDVTAEWLTEALALRHPGVEVTRVEHLDFTQKAAGRLRLGLEYDDAGVAAGLPETMCIKASFDHDVLHSGDERNAFDDMNATEGTFYDVLAPRLGSTINVPTCFYVAMEDDGPRTRLVLLMEDLSAGRFGSFDQPLAPDDVAAALEQLASLHASWWESPDLTDAAWVPTTAPVVTWVLSYLTEENWQANLLDMPRAALLPEELNDFGLVRRATEAMYRQVDEGPQTLLHGDAHIGNLFFRPGEGPGWLDWQNLARGPWSLDVYYHIVGAMTIEDRRANERDLVRHYLAAVASRGIDVPSFDAAWRACLRWPFHGFNNFLSAPYIQSEEYNGVVGQRFAVAALDNDTLGVLGVV